MTRWEPLHGEWTGRPALAMPPPAAAASSRGSPSWLRLWSYWGGKECSCVCVDAATLMRCRQKRWGSVDRRRMLRREGELEVVCQLLRADCAIRGRIMCSGRHPGELTPPTSHSDTSRLARARRLLAACCACVLAHPTLRLTTLKALRYETAVRRNCAFQRFLKEANALLSSTLSGIVSFP